MFQDQPDDARGRVHIRPVDRACARSNMTTSGVLEGNREKSQHVRNELPRKEAALAEKREMSIFTLCSDILAIRPRSFLPDFHLLSQRGS
jgi:hypothetical protein